MTLQITLLAPIPYRNNVIKGVGEKAAYLKIFGKLLGKEKLANQKSILLKFLAFWARNFLLILQLL